MTTKTAFLQLRVSTEFKARIAAAAELHAQSISSFISEAILVAIAETKRAKPVATKVIRGVPKFFVACCAEAQRGGGGNYSIPGYHLASALASEMPDKMEPAKWEKEIEQLRGFLDHQDRTAAWGWFKEHFPKLMVLVPNRRKEAFLGGVYRAHEKDRIAI